MLRSWIGKLLTKRRMPQRKSRTNLPPPFPSQGNVRYFLGAQVDVSALLKECAGTESLGELIARQAASKGSAAAGAGAHDDDDVPQLYPLEQVKALSEMFTGAELDIIRRHGGSAQRGRWLDTRTTKAPAPGTRVLLADGSEDSDDHPDEPSDAAHEGLDPRHVVSGSMDGTPGNLSGVYRYVSFSFPLPHFYLFFPFIFPREFSYQ